MIIPLLQTCRAKAIVLSCGATWALDALRILGFQDSGLRALDHILASRWLERKGGKRSLLWARMAVIDDSDGQPKVLGNPCTLPLFPPPPSFDYPKSVWQANWQAGLLARQMVGWLAGCCAAGCAVKGPCICDITTQQSYFTPVQLFRAA